MSVNIPITYIFITNSSTHTYLLQDSHGTTIKVLKQNVQYSVPLPAKEGHYFIARKSDPSKKDKFKLNRNGKIQYVSGSKITLACGLSTPSCGRDIQGRAPLIVNNSPYVPICKSIGQIGGICWGEAICSPVWTPNKSVILIKGKYSEEKACYSNDCEYCN
jgi:hypothetical protein